MRRRLDVSSKKNLDRKLEHLRFATSLSAQFHQTTTLLEEVHLIHQAFPEKSIRDITTKIRFLSREFGAPLIISSMTGGPQKTTAINCALAQVAEKFNIPFAVGSLRPALLSEKSIRSFCVKERAPDVFLFGNIGIVQAAQTPVSSLKKLLQTIDADGLYIHVNPAMELVQPEGDRDFSSGYQTVQRLCSEIQLPIIIKETGCGISKDVGTQLIKTGIAAIDVAGAGGTNFVKIEQQRQLTSKYTWHQSLSEWGIPTAASIAMLSDLKTCIIGSGGIHTALDAAKALSLGAQLVGMAGIILSAYMESGIAGVEDFIEQTIDGIRSILLLAGAKQPSDLKNLPKIIGPHLNSWIKT